MLPFHWGLLGVALLIAFTHGASINSAANDDDVEYIDDNQRSKRSYKRGQTQSQYLNFGQPELDGKADAEASESGSRSTVSGTHGMGQAQSQFSSGDCSGCGVGSPVYEYSTGSPDPLILGGNVISYPDGKPSSIIGLHGTTPSGVFGPGGAFTPGAAGGPLGEPGGTLAPGAGATVGQVGQPGIGGGYAPGAGGQIGRPGPDGGYAPGAGGVSQTGRPSAGGVYAPGSPSYTPGSTHTSGGGGAGPRGRPGTNGAYIPGSTYTPASGGAGPIGRPGSGGVYAPGSTYTPGSGGTGPIGRPGADGVYAPGSAYTPGSGGAGSVGRPGADGVYTPGSTYIPGSEGVGQMAPSGPGAAYSPSGGRPGTSYIPLGGFAPGVGGAGQMTRPGAGDVYSPGSSTTGQAGAPGTPFRPSYGPSAGTSGIGQQGTIGFGKPGIGGNVQQGQKQPQPPQLIAPPAKLPGYAQGQQPGMGFSPQVPAYGHDSGQQMPTYMPGAGKQQTSNYPVNGQQLPTHGISGQRPTGATGQPDQQTSMYGQPGQQIPGTQIVQPGSFYRPGSALAPGQQQVTQHGTGQQGVGYSQQPGYAPGYGGPIAGLGGVLPGGTAQQGIHYPATAPGTQQQPGTGMITRPGAAQQGVGRPGQPGAGYGQPGIDGYQHSVGQPGTGYQQGRIPSSSGILQPGAGFGQPGIQHDRVPSGVSVVQPSTGFAQPGYGQPGGVLPDGGYVQPGGVQPGTGFNQPIDDRYEHRQPGGGAYIQPGGVQPAGGLVQPGSGSPQGGSHPTGGFIQSGPGGQPSSEHGQTGGNIQPGTVYGQPGSGVQPGIAYGQPGTANQQVSGVSHGQQGLFTGYQPSTGSFGPHGSKPGTTIQQTPSGSQQTPGYTPGYGPQIAGQPSNAGGYQGMPFGHPDQLGVQPISGHPRPVQPAGAQPGTGMGQYSGPGYSPHRGGGVQQDTSVQQGSSFGSGYDSTYGQQGIGQPNAGYGQPSGGVQYGQPGIGLSHPGDMGINLAGVGPQAGYGQPSGTSGSPYGQGPQQIAQPGSTFVQGSVQPSGVQQNIAGSGSVAAGVGGADDVFSQAESSIGNGQAAASAQGKKNGGTAKTQVQGTYSSSGSFSASAMTSDNDRSASSQVTGGAEGAMSQSQGQGGAAQSQAQVQVNEKTGGTKASSQSGGIIQQSQSEVQANDKGGLADAQSSGPGQTSSQAQIGFRPGQDGDIVRSVGGGQASAQSGLHHGNSQSQIQGTSKYGVSYHGAAQSASGTKEQVATYREQNRDLFNTISQFGGSDAVTDRVDTVYNPALTPESDIPDLQLKASRTNKEVTNTNKIDDDSVLSDDEEEEEPYDEYEDEEDYYNENPIKMESNTNDDKKLQSSSLYRTHTQTSPTQTQQVAVADPSKKYNVVQNQNGRVQTYPARTTTETVPNGFRGTVNVEKKFHTKSLETHKSENKLNITADEKSEHHPRTPDSFVTVTKSVTGSMDNSKNPPQDNKNFQSTYYTKSSTCGYFTFSCNIVYGANGRSKICRPKAPTNGKC